MTPTAEWYEADEDDSDRSITDDVTASTHETARAATETGETRVHGDADLLRKRTAALDRVAAELAEARAEVERLRMDVSHRSSTTAWQQRRAEAAEAESARLASVVAKVEALADEFKRRQLRNAAHNGNVSCSVWGLAGAELARALADAAPDPTPNTGEAGA